MQIPKSISQGKFWPMAVVLGLIFCPIFLGLFGAHTDGFLIITPKGDWLGDPEGGILFTQGRPLWVYIDSFVGWFVKSAEQLTMLRLFVFLIKLSSCYLLYVFCRRLNMGIIWAMLTALYFTLLPDNIINTIWVCNGTPESLSLLCGLASYLVLDKCTGIKDVLNWSLSAFIFLIALLIYQPAATIVFALILMKILFSNGKPWASTRNRVIQEVFLYGIILGVYWVLIKHLIIPYGKEVLKLSPTSYAMYQMDLVKDITTKIPLVVDLLKYALVGTWDLIWHFCPPAEWGLIAIFAIGVVIVSVKRKARLTATALQKIFFALCLFFLANAPALLAINYKAVVGYRTFLSSSLMGLALVILFFRYSYGALRDDKSKKMAAYAIGIYFLMVMAAAAWTIHQSVRNYTREYNYLDNIASRIDYQNINKVTIVLNRPGETVIEYDLPFEFGYMATTSGHIRYIFDKYSDKAGQHMTFKEVYLGWPLYMDDHTQVVDMTLLRGGRSTYARPGRKVAVHVNVAQGQDVFVEEMGEGAEYPVLLFKEKIRNVDGVTAWQIKPGDNQGIVNFHFMDTVERALGYRMEVACTDAGGNPCNFGWMVQGVSPDRKGWIDMSSKTWQPTQPNPSGMTFDVPGAWPTADIRFIFFKQNANDTLTVKAIQLFSLH